MTKWIITIVDGVMYRTDSQGNKTNGDIELLAM